MNHLLVSIVGFCVILAPGLRVQLENIPPEALAMDKINMGPPKEPHALRFTLLQAVSMLQSELISFTVLHGTLLQLIRNGDLSGQDNDVDILVNVSDIPKVRSMLLAHNLKLRMDKTYFLRTESMLKNGGAPLDIYGDVGRTDYVCDQQGGIGYPRKMFEPYRPRQFKINGTIITIDVPAQPENLNVVNYGEGWRTPGRFKSDAGRMYWKTGCSCVKDKERSDDNYCEKGLPSHKLVQAT